MWKVQWDNYSSVTAECVEDVDAVLDRLSAEYVGKPILVVVESLEGHGVFTIAVGGNLSLSAYQGASGDPPYYSSVGQPDASGIVQFGCMGESTEIPSRKLIPCRVAREAVRVFLQTGAMDSAVQWEED